MKRFDLILNSILVIIIVGLVLIVPESHNTKTTNSILSKSLTTSLINATEKEIVLDVYLIKRMLKDLKMLQ